MKFLADMGISLGTVAFLRDLGHDAVHVYEQGLGRLSDSDILRKARDEGCVLLTHDLDFGELMAASGRKPPHCYHLSSPRYATARCQRLSQGGCDRAF